MYDNQNSMTTRIPNLLHLLLFLALTAAALVCAEAGLAAFHLHDVMAALMDQRLQIYTNIVIYLLAIAFAAGVFPLVWHRSFAQGVSWNLRGARPWLLPAGIVLGFCSQAVSSLLPMPQNTPMEKIFETPHILWVLALFGTLVAPLFEEIVFRGFLLPGIAIVVDYLRLPRNLGALETFRRAEGFSRPALLLSTLVTSLLFGLVHAWQLGYTWSAVALLSAVSILLCVIRIRSHSVAASFSVHAAYNFSVFLTLFFTTGGFHHLDKL